MLFTVLFAKTLLLRIYGSLPVIFWVFHNLKKKKLDLFSTQKKLQDVVVASVRSLELP